MRRLLALFTLAMLLAAAVMPAAVMAKGGPPAGKGPGNAPGQMKKAAPPSSTASVDIDDSADESVEDGSVSKPGTSDAKGKGKAKGQGSEKGAVARERARERKELKRGGGVSALEADGDDVADGDLDGDGDDLDDGDEPGDGDDPAEVGKQTGIANALSRIMANIERAEAKVAAGQKSHVPHGLLKVMAKFMGWLGIEPDEGVEPDPAAPDVDDQDDVDPLPESDEETATPEPPSDEDTDTVEPEVEE